MLPVDTFAPWIDPSVKDVRSILGAANADGLVCCPVSRDVNNVRNDNARIVERAAEPVDVAGAKGKTLSLFCGRGWRIR